MSFFSEQIRRQQFLPNFWGILINPFFLARRELSKNISRLANSARGRLLDVGCGQKPYKILFKNISEYVGLDYDTPSNRKRSSADFFYEGKNFPFEDSFFDSVLLTQVLEHIFNPDDFIKEIRRVLKSGGLLILTTPFVWDEHDQPYDYARYSSFGLRHLISSHRFEVVEHQKTLPDARVIFQLINGYLYKKLPIKNYKIRLFFYIFLFGPITIAGILFSLILPKNKDLYLDNIILAKKI